MEIKIGSFTNVRETSCGIEGGVDVDVRVTVDGETHEAEVTLQRDHNGDWAPCGPQPDYWVSSGLLEVIRDLDDDSYADFMRELSGEAVAAVEREMGV